MKRAEEDKTCSEDGPLGCHCNGSYVKPFFIYEERPKGETLFPFTDQDYHREIHRCDLCAHYVSICSDEVQHELERCYQGEYVTATYSDAAGLKAQYERIRSLDPRASDNEGRARRVIEFSKRYSLWEKLCKPISLLDIGSGLGVFPARMKEVGWECTALDPDERAADHIQRVVGIPTICEDYRVTSDLGRFDLVSFNKVLEHVIDPVTMLGKAHENLKEEGVVYVEVPDGETASREGMDREEFFIEHYHIFSLASLDGLVRRAGFRILEIERVREPSTKYTLRTFLAR